MLEIKLHPDYFGLVRLGKKTSTVRHGARFDPDGLVQLGLAELVHAENEKLRIPILIYRVSYTAVGLLTGEDAQRDGFLNLGQLLDALRKHYPDLTLDDVVTIYYFHRADREPS